MYKFIYKSIPSDFPSQPRTSFVQKAFHQCVVFKNHHKIHHFSIGMDSYQCKLKYVDILGLIEWFGHETGLANHGVVLIGLRVWRRQTCKNQQWMKLYFYPYFEIYYSPDFHLNCQYYLCSSLFSIETGHALSHDLINLLTSSFRVIPHTAMPQTISAKRSVFCRKKIERGFAVFAKGRPRPPSV